MYKIYLAIICLLQLSFSDDIEYQSLISQGNNFFDLNELDKALVYYKKATQIKKEAADAYFQIGHIHLSKGFNDVAIKYFTKAEVYTNFFIINETLLDLYLNMSAVYHRERHLQKEVDYLKKILSISTNYKSSFYQNYCGKAFFLLALLDKNKNRIYSAKEFFSKATAYNYRLKSCYMYLTHYYAINTQAQIDKNLKLLYPNLKRTENRNIFFNYYYSKYNSTPPSEDERSIFGKDAYKQYIEEIEEYKRIYNANIDSRKNQKLKGASIERKK